MAERLTRRQVLAGSGGALTLTVLPRALGAATVPETGDLRAIFKTHFGDQVPTPGGFGSTSLASWKADSPSP